MTWKCSGCDSVLVFDKELKAWACENCGYVDDYYEG